MNKEITGRNKPIVRLNNSLKTNAVKFNELRQWALFGTCQISLPAFPAKKNNTKGYDSQARSGRSLSSSIFVFFVWQGQN